MGGQWNRAVDWTPATVPNGPDDIATFALSDQASVSISGDTEVSSVVFNSGSDAFTISNTPGVTLTISGAGIANSSGVLQNFVNQENRKSAGQLYFTNDATAGDSTVYTNQTPFLGGMIFPLIQFEDNSTAGSAQFINMGGGNDARAGVIEFQGNSTAGNGTFQNIGPGGQNSPVINFRDQASAGEAVITNDESTTSYVNFYDDSTADHATITNEAHLGGGGVWFYDNSTAGSATIINEGDTTWNGYTYFLDNSTAGDGLFIVNGSLVTNLGYAQLDFWENSTAGNGTFIVNGGQVSGAGGGHIYINQSSSAEDGTFYANGATVSGAFGGRVIFYLDVPTAATATFIATGGTGGGGGGGIVFYYSSTGDKARVEVFGNGFLDIRGHDTPELTIGSLEGDGLVFLGGANLSVGSNNLNTTFSGLIEGDGGALTKIGAGILELSGANTYTGRTTVNAGGLVINNATDSGTGTGAVHVDAGILAGNGTISGPVTVGTGSGTGAFLTPGMGASKATTLTIQSAVTFKSDGTCTCRLNTKKSKADQVVANGVTIKDGAQFAFKVTGDKQLRTGKSATVISNTAATPISGTFANLPDGSTFTVGPNTFQVSYSGGDGNDLTLTVVP